MFFVIFCMHFWCRNFIILYSTYFAVPSTTVDVIKALQKLSTKELSVELNIATSATAIVVVVVSKSIFGFIEVAIVSFSEDLVGMWSLYLCLSGGSGSSGGSAYKSERIANKNLLFMHDFIKFKHSKIY